MSDDRKMTQKRLLSANDVIAVEEGTRIPCGHGFIVLGKQQGNTLDFTHIDPQGEAHSHSYDFSHGALTIGRSPRNEFQLPESDLTVSRDHAQIRLKSNGTLSYKHISTTNDILNPHYVAQAKPVPDAAAVQIGKLADKDLLNQGDVIPMENGTTLLFKDTPVTTRGLRGTRVLVEYVAPSGPVSREWDLAKGPIRIGRNPVSEIYVPDAVISGKHGEIKLHRGQVVYEHLSGTNPIFNPHYSGPEPEGLAPDSWSSKVGSGEVAAYPLAPLKGQKAIAAEGGGTGGGYTEENKKPGNGRKTNEDVGYAGMYIGMDKQQGMDFSRTLIKDEIGHALKDEAAGSTLSMALKTKDGHFVVATLGDSPVLSIMQNEKTGDIYLGQISVPDTLAGGLVRGELAKYPNEVFWDKRMEVAKAGMATDFRDVLENVEKRFASTITKSLGSMGQEKREPSGYTPDVFAVDIQKICPPGFVSKGLLVCSDGILSGIKKGEVQKALKPLFANGANPSPGEISKAAVEAAMPHSHDNITAVALMHDAAPGNLVAVADGNTGTSAVAEAAIGHIRQKTLNKPSPVKSDSWAAQR